MGEPLYLFAPGAGAPSSHPWMKHWVRLLGHIGKVRTLDYPYMLEERRRPDRLPVLIPLGLIPRSLLRLFFSVSVLHSKMPRSLLRGSLLGAHRAALARARKAHRGPIVLIGKSMGSRVGCHVAREEKVRAVVCLGYPLCGMGDREKMRDEVLLELRTPILFVQGTRDALCPLDLLDSVRRRMKAANKLEIVDDGDHSLTVAKRTLKAREETQLDNDNRVLTRIAAFVKSPNRYPGGPVRAP